ncbi:MAG: Acg family FMN-binding oxidoreductase, partial [Alphaproteobacteria bacterium]
RLSLTAGSGRLEKLRRLTAAGLILEIRTPAKFNESIELMRIGAGEIAEHRDGLNIHGPMMWWLRRFGLLSREAMRDPSSTSFEVGLDMAREQGGTAMAFAWLTTADNQRATQLAAGRAYLRLHLKSTELGLAQHPMSQLLQEYSEMAALQAQFLKVVGAKPGETVQMLARLGHASPAGPAPRRRLGDMIRA